MRFERYGIGIAKGMSVTLKHLFRPPITMQYPEEKLIISQRARGNDLVWYPEKCTGCATCVKSCPQGNIVIATHIGSANNYVVDTFELDTGRCMFCGLCVESCPYEALAMGIGYERAQYRRKQLILNKEDLQPSELRRPSGYARPKIETTLPKQSLLIYADKEVGGQKLSLIPLSKKRGRGV